MAIYHCNVQVISRGNGRSALAAAAYRAREKLYDKQQEKTHDYSKKTDLYDSEILTPTGAPTWMQNREKLWNAVEAKEKRKDAQLAREFILALPKELNNTQRKDLVHTYCRNQFTSKGMVADIALHDFDGHNPHAHVMLTMRSINKEGFGNKQRDWNKKDLLKAQREAWAIHVNKSLERAGHDARVDHRSLAEQGKNQAPQIHLGPTNHRRLQQQQQEQRRDGHTKTEDTYTTETYKRIQSLNQRLKLTEKAIKDLEKHQHTTTHSVLSSMAPENRTADIPLERSAPSLNASSESEGTTLLNHRQLTLLARRYAKQGKAIGPVRTHLEDQADPFLKNRVRRIVFNAYKTHNPTLLKQQESQQQQPTEKRSKIYTDTLKKIEKRLKEIEQNPSPQPEKSPEQKQEQTKKRRRGMSR